MLVIHNLYPFFNTDYITSYKHNDEFCDEMIFRKNMSILTIANLHPIII